MLSRSPHTQPRLHALLALPLLLGACDTEDAGGSGVEDSDSSSADEGEDGEGGGEDAELDELPAPTLPDQLADYSHELPAHFETNFVTAVDNTPGNNQVSDAGATLGRVLFWDKRLSLNGAVACGSCHDPGKGLSDDVALSVGFDGDLTGRNSMPLINLRWYERGAMFWDERADTLEDQVLMPIQDAAEMGLTLEQLVSRVEDADYYGPLFEAAFGDASITEERIAAALAQFVRSIVSYRSAWDEGVASAGGDPSGAFANFTAEENLGKDVFFGRGRCGTCHMILNPISPPPPGPTPPTDNLAIMFVDVPTNNGLDDPSDAGVGDVSGQPQDVGKFKSSSLRNVELTAPYMHDGRFETLEEVVAHYNEGIEDHPNLDPRLRDPQTQQPLRLNLNPQEQDALVAFMLTFTDETLATDPRWSDPF